MPARIHVQTEKACCLLKRALLIVSFITSIAANEIFAFPAAFEGTWQGSPTFNIIGPFAVPSYIFFISKAPCGDYLLEVNLIYDSSEISGYQRFYVQSSGNSAGALRYCGSLSNYSNSVELANHLYYTENFPTADSTEVTFCLDTSFHSNNMFPFPVGCTGCSCSNWTMSYNNSASSLFSQLVMSGPDGSVHLSVDLKRIGDAPIITDNDVPPHDSFTCEFDNGGRDSQPVHVSTGSITKSRLSGCPHFALKATSMNLLQLQPLFSNIYRNKRKHNQLREGNREVLTNPYDYCYQLNDYVDYQLRWSVDNTTETISVEISTPHIDNSTWIALGFRPLSRSYNQELTLYGTGKHMNFGMQGADIVVGSVYNGVRTLYAYDYVGEPIADNSLQLFSCDIKVVGNRLVVAFTRSFYGGYLLANYGVNASIVSTFSDIIWAVGKDTSSHSEESQSGCEYHENERGVRPIDWNDPESAMLDDWKCV